MLRDAVVPRQPLVDERVVRGQQLERRCDPPAAGSRGIAPSRAGTPPADSRRNPGTASGSGRTVAHVAQIQPLTEEVLTSAVDARVGQHPPDLLLEDAGILAACRARRSPAARRPGCCSRGKTTAGRRVRGRSTIGVRCRRLRWIPLDPEQEVRVDQQPLERCLNAFLEVPVAPPAQKNRAAAACPSVTGDDRRAGQVRSGSSARRGLPPRGPSAGRRKSSAGSACLRYPLRRMAPSIVTLPTAGSTS